MATHIVQSLLNRSRGTAASSRILASQWKSIINNSSSPSSISGWNTNAQTTIGQHRWGHTVRIILTTDLGEGKGYEGDVISVRAGYARNFLIPQKKALYATPENFTKLNIVDPELDSKAANKSVVEEEGEMETSQDQKEADTLRHYLRNKILKIYRNVDASGACTPGMVDTKTIRAKLSKQLKIDLDDMEHIKITAEPVASFLELEPEIENYLENMGDDSDKEADAKVQIRQIGDYVAKIFLVGGFSVPLKFTVMKR